MSPVKEDTALELSDLPMDVFEVVDAGIGVNSLTFGHGLMACSNASGGCNCSGFTSNCRTSGFAPETDKPE
ncbi:thiomuracin/GE37468 family thiazolyl RiPP peptide [Saccharopolyspora shandongensis]|uniref:thiomuracin/GE37468 family thiazolyl RiPP peptide n=1 Tax=Saccharopolyspora shandongensis TaxID=418495 RepID=UPI00343418F3